MRTDDIALPLSYSSKLSTASMVHHDDTREILATSPENVLLAALVKASPDKQTVRLDLGHRCRQEDRNDDGDDDAKNDSLVFNDEKQQPAFSHSENTHIAPSTTVPDQGKETENQWLSAAMESASLKDDNLAYSHVQGFLSSTPATTRLSSWGSLFLKRSPRIVGFTWSLSPLPKVSPTLAWSSVRSAEMPAPMLTGPVDEELRTSRSAKDPPTSGPVHISEPRNRNEDLVDIMSLHDSPRSNSLDGTTIESRQSSKETHRTALMLAVARQQRRVIYTLLKAAFTHGQWPTLSTPDDNGDTILDLAKAAHFSGQLGALLRSFVAVVCCTCTESRRRDCACGKLARRGYLESYELTMAHTGCRWGERLCRQNWPQWEWGLEDRAKSALEEIDDRVRELRALDAETFRARRQRMLSEWTRCKVFFS